MADRNADIYDLKAYRNRQSAARLLAEKKAAAASPIPAVAPRPRSEAVSAASFAMPAAFFAFWPSLPPDQSREHDGA